MSSFGWSYPPGAATDPSAPYNQEPPSCKECGALADAEPLEDGYALCEAHDTDDERLAIDQQRWDERLGEAIHAESVLAESGRSDLSPSAFRAIKDRARDAVIERYGPRPGGLEV